MRIRWLATGVALLWAAGGGAAWAQVDADASCLPGSDAVCLCADDGCTDTCVADSCCGDGCGAFRMWQAQPPWRLPQPCALQRLGVSVGGWLQAGITANGEDPADRFNGPMLVNDRDGELQMHQLWLYLERPCNTGGCGFDVGGRFDMFYGTDWRAMLCHGQGLEDEINGLDQSYGLSLPQFYLEVALNRLSVKVGRMLGILGYETVPPMGNFFYSHTYTMCYGEPLLITGLMGNYALTDQLTLLAGFHEGVGQFEDNNDVLNFQGGFAWTSCDGRTSLAYALDAGRNDAAGLQDEYVHSIVFSQQLGDGLKYVLQNDIGQLNGIGGAADSEWYSINNYLIYTINQRWSAGLRVEWFRDDDGAKILGLGNLPDARGWMGALGYAGSFTDLSLGVNWSPKSNILVRPELRWDWYDGLANPAGPYPLPFDDGTSSSQFTAAMDVIVMF